MLTPATIGRAAAQPSLDANSFSSGLLVMVVVLLGAVAFSVFSAVLLVRARDRVVAENADLRLHIADLAAARDRAEAIVAGGEQRYVAWSAPGEPPTVVGTLPEATGAPADRSAFLAFGRWLQPQSAGQLDAALARLREFGEPFAVTVTVRSQHNLEVEGRPVGGVALACFRDLSGDRLARTEIESDYRRLAGEAGALRALLADAPVPAWFRDRRGGLTWVNAAYAIAVDASDADAAISARRELFDGAGREALRSGHETDRVVLRRLPASVDGTRCFFDVADVALESGSGGVAIDSTAAETATAALRREVEFNARTLDQLATAVAIFGPDRRLKSCNAAYRGLFDLDAGFLDSAPDETAVLDRMRAARKLPEQADFKTWREGLLAAYRSPETREQWWHLPDGRTLRVIANPNPQGGMTWVYENVTERLDLESRYNALIRVQGETLDHLSEGVAVFGSSGRLRLHNPSFPAIFALDPGRLAGEPHIVEVVNACRQPGDTDWDRLIGSVAGVDDSRDSLSGRMERAGGRVIDYATVPLLNGQTMVTFVDVTDSVAVERVLVEKNEALEAAARLKNAFIHHVSYELRSPLTSIIGFSQMLTDPAVGALNERQREYTGYILSSGSALLAIINDILDLATIDAGIMQLDLDQVDIAETIESAIEGLQDRLEESRIRLETHVERGVGWFVADGKRVRQVLFNLLANAVSFSPRGGSVELKAGRDGDTIAFTITDHGPGVPADFVDSAFDRFASRAQGEGRGGVGLGLSIVKSFVDLHGGSVAIESAAGEGTRVTCRLPIRPPVAAAAAE